jgi:uroporphyrinogen-III synthase
MPHTAPIETRPLGGQRILIPRGGPWGDQVASALRSQGASTVIAPMTNYVVTENADELQVALNSLAAGTFDVVTFSSATTVDVVAAYRAIIPSSTKVAAVGETTAAALAAAGYRADLVPVEENTVQAMLEQWAEATDGVIPLKVLTIRSEQSIPILTDGLRRIGHDVESVVAYRTVGIEVDPEIVEDVKDGEFDILLVTSGTVAEQIAFQFGPIPKITLTAAMGPRTARDARTHGVRVDVIAEEQDIDALVSLLIEYALASA